MKKYFIFHHPILPRNYVPKDEFNWVPFIVGPFWLLWKKMWGIAAIAIAIYILSYILADASGILATEECIGSGFGKICDDVPSPIRDFLLHASLNFLLGTYANEIWAYDLERRGYENLGHIDAKSADHLLGILAKENMPRDDDRS